MGVPGRLAFAPAPSRRRLVKIAYVIHWLKGPESGVFKKVAAHCEAWTQLGADVRLFVLTRAGSAAEGAWAAAGVPTHEETYEGFASRFRAADRLADAVAAWGPDLVYRRYAVYLPGFGRLARIAPVVLEINSDDVSEGRMAGRPSLGAVRRRLWNELTRPLTFRDAAGAVFVTRELAGSPRFARFGLSHVVIANGTRLDGPPAPASSTERPRLFFIGFPGQAWHGIDKIYALARRRPDYDFDLVGVPATDVPEDLRDRVTGHGTLVRDAYLPLLALADVAVGTLALHRKEMDEACPLKVREYLGHGVPTLIGYEDTDFPEPVDFLLRLPNTEANVEEGVEEIARFVERWRGRRFDRARVAHLDATAKEQRRYAFFREVVAESGTRARGGSR